MSETNTTQPITESTQSMEPGAPDLAPQWGMNTPRGGKTVVNRVLKEGRSRPPFPGADPGQLAPRPGVQQHHVGAVRARG